MDYGSLFMKLVLATRNRHKIQELVALLEPSGVDIVTFEEISEWPDVSEEGATPEANAVKKATAVADATSLPALADDSGLEIDALGGAPGVRSARFCGEQSTAEERNARILELLGGVPPAERSACFRCVLALAVPGGGVSVVEGVCEGSITDEPRGRHGFGYDPIFLFPGKGMTFAELTPAEKNRVSHRGRAVAKLLPILKALSEGMS